jgi:hypothetical protein
MVLQIIYNAKELGISPKAAASTVANRVETLLSDNCFLHAQFFVSIHYLLSFVPNSLYSQGSEPPPAALYKSPILKKIIEVLYTTDPWRTAIIQPWVGGVSIRDQPFTVAPPITFVAFAAAAVSLHTQLSHITDLLDWQYRNALDSLLSGTEDTTPFSEIGYARVYLDFHSSITDDTNHFVYGEVVRNNLQSLIANVTFL